MLNYIFMFISLFALSIANASADTPPSKGAVETWWYSMSTEKMTIIDPLIEIRLQNKEVAYLAEAAFDRGRNDMFHVVMIRPLLKTVEEIEESVRQNIEVYDLDHDGISEVVASAVSSGQGSESGIKSIVQFDGSSPTILHQAEFESGCAADLSSCSSRLVSWKFVDLNNDGNSDLIEEITLSEGHENKPTITSKEIHKFLFKGGQFTIIDVPNNAAKSK